MTVSTAPASEIRLSLENSEVLERIAAPSLYLCVLWLIAERLYDRCDAVYFRDPDSIGVVQIGKTSEHTAAHYL